MNKFELQFCDHFLNLAENEFFEDLIPGTPEYETRYQDARAEFFLLKTKSQEYIDEVARVQLLRDEVTEPIINVELAEKYKLEGNSKLSAQKYIEATVLYGKAIKFNPNNHIYYANRAASLSYLEKYDAAIINCQKAIEINSNYPKVYGRLG